jgi:hypothetical protein
MWLYATDGWLELANCPKSGTCDTTDAGRKKCECTCAVDVDAMSDRELIEKASDDTCCFYAPAQRVWGGR